MSNNVEKWSWGYVDFEITDKSDLKISLNQDGLEMEEYEWEQLRENHNDYSLLQYLADNGTGGAWGNGWAFMSDNDIYHQGWLTEAPVIVEDPEYFGEEEEEFIGQLTIKSYERGWWFPDYMVIDLIEKLRTDGFIIFTNLSKGS
jgi:hypothetical protein